VGKQRDHANDGAQLRHVKQQADDLVHERGVEQKVRHVDDRGVCEPLLFHAEVAVDERDLGGSAWAQRTALEAASIVCPWKPNSPFPSCDFERMTSSAAGQLLINFNAETPVSCRGVMSSTPMDCRHCVCSMTWTQVLPPADPKSTNTSAIVNLRYVSTCKNGRGRGRLYHA
jgi:hypothetical protein